MSAAAERNLLFGILALQMDFISGDALIQAMNAWVLDKGKPLAQILVEQKALSTARRSMLEPLVEEHIKQHGNDPELSLAAVSAVGSVRDELDRIADPDLQASLIHFAATHPPDIDPLATAEYLSAGDSTSAGQRFRILRLHATGGLGEVFVARDEELHREVALKQIQDRHACDPHCRARFLLEAEITGGLEHPGVVPVYGLGRYADGRPFYAMRFVKGDSLKVAIERYHRPESQGKDAGERALEFRRLLGRFVDVCNAIAYAHSRGVLHRDLKPGNVMLGPYGETLVVDWGLAKVVGRQDVPAPSDELTLRPEAVGGSAPTVAGSAIGTPQFMSPEQAGGKLDQLGPATDVYSLGATLYALLTGQVPFAGVDRGEVLERVRCGYFPAPRHVRPDVPQPLEAICQKAMALRPQDRYPSARGLADDIENWLADEPVVAYAEPWTAKARRWLGRHRTLAITSAALVLLATVLLAAGNVLLTAANRAEQAARHEAEANARQVRNAKRLSDHRLYISDMRLAQRAWEDNQIGRLLELLEGQRPEKTGGEDIRGFEWHYWWRLCHSDLLTLMGHANGVTSATFSPDGKRIASASYDKTAKVWDAGTGKDILTLKGHAAEVSCVAFSPDGKRIASASEDKTVRLWDTASGQEILTLKGHAAGVTSVAFSPDSKRIASASHDNSAKIWDATTGQEILTLNVQRAWVTSVAFSPDGKRIASACEDNTVKVWEATSGQQILTLKAHASGVTSVAFSPDGSRIAGGTHDNTAKVWEATTGHEILSLKGHAAGVTSVAFSPNGKRIASASHDNSVKIWDATTGQEILTFKGHAAPVLSVAFSPDGKRIASASLDISVKVWGAVIAQENLALKGHVSVVTGVAFSPDGRRITSASMDRTARVWDATTGQETLTLKGHAAGVTSVAFSPDGERIASASYDKTARVWDATTGQEILTFKGHVAEVTSVAFSPNGKRIASASHDNSVKIWDATTGQEVLTLKGHAAPVLSVALSPDGKRIASACHDNSANVWDASTGQEILTFKGHAAPVLSVAFSPDGKRIASGGMDQTSKLWDAATGQEILTLKGHAAAVFSVAFSHDGTRIVSASTDGRVKVWELATGQEILTLKGDARDFACVAFSLDAKRIASGSEDNTARVWDSDLPTAQERLRREAYFLVDSLFVKYPWRPDVVDHLQGDPELDESLRQAALASANRYIQQPQPLNDASWAAVSKPGVPAAAYRRALMQAQEACRLDPQDGLYLNTRGVAEYRTGAFQQALETLTRSASLNMLLAMEDKHSIAVALVGMAPGETKLSAIGLLLAGEATLSYLAADPADLAFLAMTHYQLGHKQEAKAILTRMQATMKLPRWADNVDAKAFLREAEALLQGQSGKTATK
jgi:WD40 repeat protein